MDEENVNQTPDEDVTPEVEVIETPEPVAVPEPPVAPEPPAPPAPPAAPGYAPPPPPAPGAPAAGTSEKNKVVAGVLAILLGSLGVHKFYLGYNKEGIILLLATVLTAGMLSWVTGVIGIVEGVIYLTKTDQDFYAAYVAGRKPWF